MTTDDGKLFLMAIGLMIITLCVAFYFGIKDDNEFKKYAKAHNCVVIDKRTRLVLVWNGTVNQPIPMTDYLYECDNGELIWR